MKLEPDNGRRVYEQASEGAIDAPLEDFHGVPFAERLPHDTALPETPTVGMRPTGGAGYVPAPVTKGD